MSSSMPLPDDATVMPKEQRRRLEEDRAHQEAEVERIAEGLASQQKRPSGTHHVYVVLNHETERIKIGLTAHPDQRLKSIQSMSGSRLILLGLFNHGRRAYAVEHEQDLHDRFADARIEGTEWFELTPRVKDFAFGLKAQGHERRWV